jgi:hypothetical protein
MDSSVPAPHLATALGIEGDLTPGHTVAEMAALKGASEREIRASIRELVSFGYLLPRRRVTGEWEYYLNPAIDHEAVLGNLD